MKKCSISTELLVAGKTYAPVPTLLDLRRDTQLYAVVLRLFENELWA